MVPVTTNQLFIYNLTMAIWQLPNHLIRTPVDELFSVVWTSGKAVVSLLALPSRKLQVKSRQNVSQIICPWLWPSVTVDCWVDIGKKSTILYPCRNNIVDHYSWYTQIISHVLCYRHATSQCLSFISIHIPLNPHCCLVPLHLCPSSLGFPSSFIRVSHYIRHVYIHCVGFYSARMISPSLSYIHSPWYSPSYSYVLAPETSPD